METLLMYQAQLGTNGVDLVASEDKSSVLDRQFWHIAVTHEQPSH
jgi:hypothetical protein